MLISLSKPKCGSRYIDTCPAKNIQSGIMIILIKNLLRATFKIDREMLSTRSTYARGLMALT